MKNHVVSFALAFALVGCTAVLGADFDRPAAGAPAVDDAGASTKNTVVPAADGSCPPARRRCGDACALTDDPAFGCSQASCSPCAIPRDGIATCDARLACDFTCARGFEKVDGRCVGWRIETTTAPELTAVIGRGPNEIYVAGGTPWEPPRMLRSNGDGRWLPHAIGTPENRTVYGFATTSSGDIFLGLGLMSLGESARPLFKLGADSTWQPMDVGDPPTSITGVWAFPSGEVFALVGNDVRHFMPGKGWTLEKTDLDDAVMLFGFTEPTYKVDVVYAIGRSGALSTPRFGAGNGTWGRPAWGLPIETIPEGLYLLSVVRSGDEYWMVGANGVILYARGSFDTFTRVPSGTDEMLNGVWATGKDVWVVGSRGTILHAGEDRRFERVESGTDADLKAVWGTGPNDVYIVGVNPGLYAGTILHRN